jgi:hypothetical protein
VNLNKKALGWIFVFVFIGTFITASIGEFMAIGLNPHVASIAQSPDHVFPFRFLIGEDIH